MVDAIHHRSNLYKTNIKPFKRAIILDFIYSYAMKAIFLSHYFVVVQKIL